MATSATIAYPNAFGMTCYGNYVGHDISSDSYVNIEDLLSVSFRHNKTYNYGYISIPMRATCNGITYDFSASLYGNVQGYLAYWPPQVYYSLSRYGYFSLSDLFTAANKTTRTLPVSFSITSQGTGVCSTSSGNSEGFPVTAGNIGALCSITLNAPPQLYCSVSSSGRYYASVTKYKVNVTTLRAQFGGDITNCVLTVGNQTASRTTTGTLEVTVPSTPDTYTPTVVATDSRGQTTTKTLASITVESYACSISNPSAERILNYAPYTIDDEGTNVLIRATFNFSQYTGSNLKAPTVIIDENTSATVTWYTSYSESSGFSGQVTNWNNIASGTTLYGRCTNAFAITTSYRLDITPKTNITDTYSLSVSTVRINIAQAFYLLAGRPGGHGLGIGKKPNADDFEIGIDAVFEEDIFIHLDTTAASGTDHDIIAEINSRSWSSLISDEKLDIRGLLLNILQSLPQ